MAGPQATQTEAVWKDTRAFYAERRDAPAWLDDRSASRATKALEMLRTAPAHGFATTDYDEPQLTAELKALLDGRRDAPGRIQRLADLDVRLTVAVLTLGRDVALGRTTPAAIDSRWKARRDAPDFAGTLARAVEGDLRGWLDVVRPPHPEYAALQKALADLRAQQEQGDWPNVPAGTFRLGQSHPSVVVLRRRLAAEGALGAAAASTSPVYDADVNAAVRSFQERHSIKATGLLDAATLAAMNVSLADRIRQVAVNLERWRWMPSDLGPRHFLVNIPSFRLTARENGHAVEDMRVVVGKIGHETPVFSGEMANVVFSPYWNVPTNIVQDETAPAAARDPGYLARNDIEILRASKSGSTAVDPSDVDWDNPSELRQLAFRQRPGSKNALGHVKFLFPNPFDVYIHDTPADALFARAGRAFSHGCVRVEEPEALARYVLRNDSLWDEPRILAAMHSGVEKYVKLKETIPVHIVYFTTWVDDGGLHFEPDVYGYDGKQLTPRKLN